MRENEWVQLTNEFYSKTEQQAAACADAGRRLSNSTHTSTLKTPEDMTL